MLSTVDTSARIPPAGQARDYARLVRFEHALFSLPMFIAGALVAGRASFPSWPDWVLIIVAGTSARNLALALNRLIDHKIDLANPRTRTRELPLGRLSPTQVEAFILLNVAVYGLCAWLIAPVCLYLAPIPLLVFALYPYMKRFTALCHLGVGVGLAMAPLGGYLAAAKVWPIAPEAWFLALFTWLWVSGFDIIYAQLDIDFDRAHGVFSLPARWGRRALDVSALMHAAAVLVLVGLWGFWFDRDPWLWLPIGIMVLLFTIQHVRRNHVDFAAFHVNTLVGFVMLAFVVVGVVR